jgi:hypothetical protein
MKNAQLEQNLLVFLKNLPPVECWLYCLTEDQKDQKC